MTKISVAYDRFEHVGVERQDGIALVRLGTGDPKSAVGDSLHSELECLFQELARDRETDVIVLTGAQRVFSAGGDVRWMSSILPEQLEYSIAQARRLIEALISLSQPTIAAVNGHAIGLGCTLALCCDITVVADDAKVGDPHVRLGLVAGDGGAVVWPLLVGLHRANRYLLTGELLSGAEAAEIGLMGEAVPHDEVLERAMDCAETIANLPRPAVRGTKRSLVHALGTAMHSTLELSLAHEHSSAVSTEHREAVTAFLEKRDPEFDSRRT